MPRKRATGTVTLSDVARLAGVSTATASRAINGSSSRAVGEELSDRVKRAAELLGYAPDANAQAMAKGASRTMGVAVHDLNDPYFSAIAAGMVSACEQHEIFLTLASTGGNIERMPQVLQSLDSLRVRAILIAGGRWQNQAIQPDLADAIRLYRRRGGRVVTVGTELAGLDQVHLKAEEGLTQLANELWRLGYRKPIVLAGPKQHSTAIARTHAFVSQFRNLGGTLPDANRIHCSFTRPGGVDGMRQALADGVAGDVVVAMTDVMALGAITVARQAGVSVPSELGFAGFGDIPNTIDVVPNLTTVHAPLADMGAAAIDLALNGPGDGTGVVRFDAQVVIRDSTPGPS